MSPEQARRLVAENVSEIAKQQGMSVNKLADFAGVNRPHLTRFLQGKADVTVGWLAQVAEALDVELATLFGPRDSSTT